MRRSNVAAGATRIVLATRNEDKAREIEAVLSSEMPGVPLQLLSLRDFPHIGEVEETGDSFEENAVKKAKFTAKETGLICLADDSGLEVDAIGGLPGVKSARFASQNGRNSDDAENRKKVLRFLEGVDHSKRTARFRCVIALATPEGIVKVKEGIVEGYITEGERGLNGFGYDPIFLYPPSGKTFAEMSPDEKNTVSHRGRALRAMIPEILEVVRQGRSDSENPRRVTAGN
ncbi:MAG TPA: XTP/dITP diphosphatase [Clostridia bacterium]|nr:XTP/dITP diphosphatase [Clostridia bacterium]